MNKSRDKRTITRFVALFVLIAAIVYCGNFIFIPEPTRAIEVDDIKLSSLTVDKEGELVGNGETITYEWTVETPYEITKSSFALDNVDQNNKSHYIHPTVDSLGNNTFRVNFVTDDSIFVGTINIFYIYVDIILDNGESLQERVYLGKLQNDHPVIYSPKCKENGHTPGEPVRENETEGSYDEISFCTICKQKISEKHVDQVVGESDVCIGLPISLNVSTDYNVTFTCETSELESSYVGMSITGDGVWYMFDVTVKSIGTHDIKAFSDGVSLGIYRINVKEHDYQTERIEPTIFEEGLEKEVCSRCGDVKSETVLKKLPASVTLSQEKLKIKKGKKKTLTIINQSEGDSVNYWVSSKPKVASVDLHTGRIKAKKKGTADIAVVMKSGCTATCTVKVK